jgi:HD-GYP domain-containing protein (c-di-GMP phosphodiesterase class II)
MRRFFPFHLLNPIIEPLSGSKNSQNYIYLHNVLKQITECKTFREILQIVLHQIQQILPADEVGFVIKNGQKETLIQIDPEHKNGMDLQYSDYSKPGFYHPDFSNDFSTVLISDTRNDLNWSHPDNQFAIRSYLAAPLLRENQPVGFLFLGSHRKSFYQEDHRVIFQLFTSQLSLAFENLDLKQEKVLKVTEFEVLDRIIEINGSASQQWAAALQNVLREIKRYFQADSAYMVVSDFRSGDVLGECQIDLPTENQDADKENRKAIIAETLESKKPYFQAWPISKVDEKHGQWQITKPTMCVPLLAEETPFGLIWINRSTAFTELDFRHLGTLASLVSSGFSRDLLFQHISQTAKNLEIINQVGRELSETLSLKDVYRRLGDTLSNLTPDVSTIMISRFNPVTRIITCDYCYQRNQVVDISHFPPLPVASDGKGTISQVIARKEGIILNDLPQHIRRKNWNTYPVQPPLSAVYAPIISKGDVIGIISVMSEKNFRFTQNELELFTWVANTAAISIENARLFSETQNRMEHLAALHSIDEAINSSFNLQLMLEVLVNQTISQLSVDAARVIFFEPDPLHGRCVAAHGFSQTMGGRCPESPVVLQEQGSVQGLRLKFIQHLDDPTVQVDERLLAEGFVSYAAASLVTKGKTLGVLEVFSRTPIEPAPEWSSFLISLSSQAAIAVGNATLFTDLQKSNHELTKAYDLTLLGWIRTLEIRDNETENHTLRVASMTDELAKIMGLPQDDLIHIHRGALLHDIGKIGIPDEILRKPGPLDENEWAIMKQHPVIAYQVLYPIDYLRPALNIPYSHHEKWDGSGYPQGLKTDQIPLAARMFSIIDVYDALSSDRPYRKAWPTEKVMDYISGQSEKHFDPEIVEIFCNAIPDLAQIKYPG